VVDQILNFIKNKYFIGVVLLVLFIYAAFSINQAISDKENEEDFNKFILVNDAFEDPEKSAIELFKELDLDFKNVGYEIVAKSILAKKAVNEVNLLSQEKDKDQTIDEKDSKERFELAIMLYMEVYFQTKDSNINEQTRKILLDQYRNNIVRLYIETDDYDNGRQFIENESEDNFYFYELAGDFYKYFKEYELANEYYDLAISLSSDDMQVNLINLKRTTQ